MADTNKEPATAHDTTEGGVIGAVGGAIVGGLAGGPVGAVIGAVVGGAASAAAVHQVDKHDHDYSGAEYRNSADDATAVGTTSYATASTTPAVSASPTFVAPATPATHTSPVTASNSATSHQEVKYDAATALRDNGNEVVIPVVEEELQVGKRVEQTGGAHIHTTVTETPVTESVNLREEHVTVDRVAVDRPATNADFGTGPQDFSLTETREVPVVSKEARVVEEVVIGKTATEHTETIRDTVRRTNVEVDDVTAKGTTH